MSPVDKGSAYHGPMVVHPASDRTMPVHVAEVLGGLGQQLRYLPDLIQRLLAAEVAELSGDGQL